MSLLRQFVALSALTASEVARTPAALLLTSTCVVLIALLPLVLLHRFGEEGRLVREGALALQFVLGLFVAGSAATTTLAREVRSGTAAAILSKPVSRGMLFTAKYAGVCAVVLAFALCAASAALLGERIGEKLVQDVGYSTDWLAARILFAAPCLAFLAAAWLNYRRRDPFTARAFQFLVLSMILAPVVCACFGLDGRPAPFDFRVDWRIVPAAALVAMGLLVFAALALAASTRLQTAPVLATCVAVFALGLVSDHLFGRSAQTPVTRTLHWLVPNWQHFWQVEALADGGAIPSAYLVQAGLYAAACGAGFLCAGAALFRNTEVA